MTTHTTGMFGQFYRSQTRRAVPQGVCKHTVLNTVQSVSALPWAWPAIRCHYWQCEYKQVPVASQPGTRKPSDPVLSNSASSTPTSDNSQKVHSCWCLHKLTPGPQCRFPTNRFETSIRKDPLLVTALCTGSTTAQDLLLPLFATCIWDAWFATSTCLDHTDSHKSIQVLSFISVRGT